MKVRKIEDVIDQMLEAIGANAPELRGRLLSVRDSAGYTPPDAMRDLWWRLTETFNTWAPAMWGCSPDSEFAPGWYYLAGCALADREPIRLPPSA